MTLIRFRLLPALPLALASLQAQAHDGHGLLGTHWHSTDALGFVGLAVMVAAAVWLSRK
jgi:hypothetical protein